MTTSYFLAVDVGTSRTAAAVARQADDGTLSAAPFTLGRHADSAPSVVFVGEGGLLFGDAAVRRGVGQPERLIREFKRRIGDEVPLIAGDQRFLPERLYARLVAWVIESVSEREGARPDAISVTVPVTWTPFRLDLVQSALAREGWPEVDMIAEPVAAARHYESEKVLEDDSILAVYDLGGGTFDAVLLRKGTDDELSVVGEPVGIAAFGGSDFDDSVLQHALAEAGLSAGELAADPSARVGLAALRRECIDAKESLSFDSETVVPVLVGASGATVRLTRSEFESMIEGGIGQSIDVLADAIEANGVNLTDIDAILLTGGSSRIPRVAQLLSERFDRPIAVDADPKAIVALGAARALAERELWAAFYAAGGDADGVDGEEPDEPAIAAERVKKPVDAATAPHDRGRRKGTRRWFGWRKANKDRADNNPADTGRAAIGKRGAATATIVTTGALTLAACVAVVMGFPLLAGSSSAEEPVPSPARSATTLPSVVMPSELPSSDTPTPATPPGTTPSPTTPSPTTPSRATLSPESTGAPLLTPAPRSGRILEATPDSERAGE